MVRPDELRPGRSRRRPPSAGSAPRARATDCRRRAPDRTTDRARRCFVKRRIRFTDAERRTGRREAERLRSADRPRAPPAGQARTRTRAQGPARNRQYRQPRYDPSLVSRTGGEEVRRQQATRTRTAAESCRDRETAHQNRDRESSVGVHTRLRGALTNLGYTIGRPTIKRILKEQGIEPAPLRGRCVSWATFIKAHVEAIAAADIFTVEVVSWLGLVRYPTCAERSSAILVAKKYDGSKRRGPGWTRKPAEIARLLIRMALENPR